MLMSHFEEPKLSDDEEPPTEQDKRKKLVSQVRTLTIVHTQFRSNFAIIKAFFSVVPFSF